MMKLAAFLFLFCAFFTGASVADPPRMLGQEELQLVQQDMKRAEDAVRKIVNQPITHLARDPTVQMGTFAPGWFHPGALKPDYATVDVRTTQEFPYDKFQFVTSDINPDRMFVSAELEFNKNTKMYYTDLTIPKRRLSMDEMNEVNRLYRIIGECEKKLNEQRVNEMAAQIRSNESFLMRHLGIILLCVFVVSVAFIYSMPSPRRS